MHYYYKQSTCLKAGELLFDTHTVLQDDSIARLNTTKVEKREELNLLINRVIITQDQQQAAEQYIRERGQPGETAEQLLASPYMLIGSIEQLIERIQRLREQFGISYFVLDADYMEVLAPVVAHLAGA